MKILIIRGVHGKTMAMHLGGWAKALLGICVFGVPLSAGWWLGSQNSDQLPEFFADLSQGLEADLQLQREKVTAVTEETERSVRSLSLHISELQSRLVRLEALGERVAERAELDTDEFDFASIPALGGPVSEPAYTSVFSGDMAEQLQQLDTQLANREMQLGLLSALMMDRNLRELSAPSGLPASSGWISSHYGMRTDPFTGEQAWHNGVDIAGREGSAVLAVASGVVSFADSSTTYGNLIEITHDNGLVTLYAHNKEILVSQGSIVQKGQQIATMGSTGRSTGPHIHFEVFKNGRSVDPASYLQSTIR